MLAYLLTGPLALAILGFFLFGLATFLHVVRDWVNDVRYTPTQAIRATAVLAVNIAGVVVANAALEWAWAL